MKKIVDKNIDLITYLKEYGFSKNKAKTYVKLGLIEVNSKIVKKLPYTLEKGSIISILSNNQNNNINIIYEDSNYLIVNKESGLVTISTTKDKYEDTLYKRVRSYLNHKHEYAFIVNRIDRDTSGIVIFVKNEKLKNQLQNNWNKIVTERKYIAIVSGIIKTSGKIDNYLYEDKQTFVHSTKYGGKRAITNYKNLKHNNKYTLLDINIETGRKNQIRVHLSEMKHPIIGDKKYGSHDNPLGRLGLHHYRISFIDPLTQNKLSFESEIPHDFYNLFN